MAQDNRKPLYTLYETLKSDNYDVPDTYESFERTLTASGKEGTTNRVTLYNSLKSDNYDVPDTYESFAKTLFEPVSTRQTAQPTSTPAHAPQPQATAPAVPASTPVQAPTAAQIQSAPDPQQPAWQPSEQEKMRRSYQMHTMLNDFNQRSKERIAQIQRMAEPFTAEGRRKRKAMEFQAQLAGTPTKVMGLTPPTSAPASNGVQGDVEGATQSQPVQSGQSPVPYGVKYIDGKPITQWLLPDGRLTTSFMEADQAEFGARTARLRHQFENRMKENGLDPAKHEDVEMQAQYDAQAPAYDAVAELWQEAEEKHKADQERNANKHWDSYAAMGGGREMRIVTTSTNRHDDNISHMTRFDIEKMMDNAWNRVGSRITTNCYNRLRQQYPGASEEELRATASEMARSLSDNAVYQYAVQQNTPKSTLEYFGRTVADMNVINSISKGLARSQAGTSGDLAAYEAAMSEYGKNHRVAQVAGTVVGMAVDPVTWVSGGVGSLAGKGALNLGGRFLSSRAAGMTTQMGSRLFGSSLTGRIIVGSAGAAGNLATYEGLKEAESQWLHGGHVNAETGGVDGYSAGEILKSTGHGMLMGSVIGPLSPVIGNVGDKAVRATTSTIGKVGVRGGEIAVSTLAEGTIFSVPQWISGEGDAFDVWTDNMAMMLGFKAQHGIKSAPRVIASLRPIKPTNGRPLTQAERNHNRMSFEERVRKSMDASPNDLAFTADEREELRRAGYGELADLFSRDRVQAVERPNINPAEGAIELRAERVEAETIHRSPEFDGYADMEELMQDGRVSQAARAKAYYILTGRLLPMGTVTGYTTTTTEDGRVTVSATTADGEIVTTRTFKNEQESKQEVDNIMRQAELNSIDVGERYKEAVAYDMVLDAAISEVSPGADRATIKRIYRAVKAGNKDVTESQVQLAEFLDDAIARNKDIADKYRTEAIREELMNETGIDVDAVLRKMPSKRTEAEQEAVKSYLERLFPEEARQQNAEPTPEQAEAQSQYEQGCLLYGRFEEGDPTVRGEVDAVALHMHEAYQAVEDAFGAEAEYYMVNVNENPWSLLDNHELTIDQQDAVLYYINAKAALDGVMDASNEAADRKRAEVEESVAKRTHKGNGMIIPATMKADDRQVYVVKGNVIMFPDGTGVDERNSSESVIVMDAQTGEYEFTSPDQIYKVSEAVNPQAELDTALSVIEQEQMSVFGDNAVAPEEPVEGAGQQQFPAETFSDTAGVTDTRAVPEPLESVPNPTETQDANAEIASETFPNVENGQQTALSRIPVDEHGEPIFEAVDKDTAWDGLIEAVGGEADAADIAMAQIQQANADLEALKKKPPTQKAPKLKGSPMAMAQAKRQAAEQYQRELAQYNQQIVDTQGRLDAWNGIIGVYTSRNAELRRQEEEERRQRDAIAHDEAVARFEQAQRVQAEKQAEQEAIGTHSVNPKLKAQWDAAPKIVGNANAHVLADGSTITGHYVLTEAGAASASHDPENAFLPTEGFPIDENGQNVNDRDYARDKDAQRMVEQMGAAFDSRALQTPVIVSQDGIVLSGNNRTMSGDIAAAQGTDKAYVGHLTQYGGMYGFTPEQIAGMAHPRVVFVPDDAMPYDSSTFSRFNAQEMKSQSKPEAAVKLGKVVTDDVFNEIVGDINRYERMSDFYANETAAASALGALHAAGVINDAQMPELRTGTALSAAGKELLENTLIGKVFQSDPDAVRKIMEIPSMRQTIVMALAEVANNRTLAAEGYALADELSKAVDLCYRAKTEHPDIYSPGIPVSPFGRQEGLFDDEYGDSRVTDATTLLLADLLNDTKPNRLRNVLTVYNKEAKSSAAGSIDLFSGTISTKEDILTEINSHFNNATPQEQQAIVDAAIAERRAAAEAAVNTTEREGGQESEQTPDAVQRSEGDGGTGGNTGIAGGLGGKTPGDLSEKSKEIDDNGLPFVVSENGTTTFGVIREESGLPGAPIKLSEGYQDENGKGYGLRHIEAGHGAEIRQAGFSTVEEFVSYVAENYDEDNIRVGKQRRNGNTTYLIQVTDSHDNTLFIELSRDGSYWNVNSGGIFRKGYSAKKETVAKTEPQQPNNAVSSDSSLSTDEQSGISSIEPNGESTVSDRKVTNSASEKQVDGEKSSVHERLATAEAKVDTDPTEAQKKAGNYKMGHFKIDGLEITIENPKGSMRRGTDADGTPWETEMKNTYGYIKGTTGVDGDKIDIFLSDNPTDGDVYVVDQYNQDGSFDEHKVMYGFNSATEAEAAYLSNYSADWAKGRKVVVTGVTREEFKKWLDASDRKTKPFAGYKSVKAISADESAAQEIKFGDVGETLATPTEATEGYELDVYETRKGKRFQRVKFPRADKEVWKERLDIAKEQFGGTSVPGGYGFKDAETAKAFAEAILHPVSAEGLKERTNIMLADESAAQRTATPQRGHAQAQAEAEPQPEAEKKARSKWFNEEDQDEAAELIRKMKARLRGGNLFSGVPIDVELLELGCRLGYLIMKKGARKLHEYAQAMIENVGDGIRPYIKQFYNATLATEEALAGEWYKDATPMEEIAKFDTVNFMKQEPTDIFERAQGIAAEHEIKRSMPMAATGMISNARRVDNDRKKLTDDPAKGLEHRMAEVSHNGYMTGDEVMWDRYSNGKWEKVKIEDFDADGSPIFEVIKGIMSEKGDWSRVKPANGIFGEAQRVARAEQEKKTKKATTDAASALTGNKPKESHKKDVTLKQEQPVGDLFGGLFDNPQDTSTHEETEMGTRPGEAGGQRQQLKQDTQVGGDEPRRETERPAGEAGSGSSGMDSDADRAGGRGLHDVATQPALERLPEKERKNVHNNHVERGTEVAPKSESARIKANIAAIETMNKLEASGEAPTADDMKRLRAFSGWGGLGKAFSDWDTSRQLRQLLGDKLYDEGAEMSRNSAYFTPAYIADAMWDIARAMGFKGGRVLEGSAGIGNVLGLMPQDLSERSYIRAVEKDPTTGKMLSLLYPDAVVDIEGFEKVKIETGTYDLVITNVPFVPGLKVADTSGDADISKEFKTSIHDFCIAKNVRKLRDGGVGVFITTAGSMDGTGRLYKWLTNHENADIVGMFRMHNETFGGTNATSDIIVVRKRVNGVKSPHAIDCSLTTGVRTAEYDTGEKKKVKNVGEVPIIKTLSMSYNRYYVEHPEYMAGEMHFGFEKGDTSFRPESKGLYPAKEKDQSQLLSQWVEDMKRNLADTSEETASTVMNHRDEYVPTYDKVGNEVKTGTIFVDSQGRICVNYDGTARPLMSKLDNKNPKSADERIAQFNKNKVKGRSRAQVVQDYNAIKKALNDLLEYQKASDSDEGLQPKLKALNHAFDSFVTTYGHLHGNNGLAWLKNDVDFPSVIALETYREEGLEHKKVFGKADVFSRRVVFRPEQPKATNVRDGVTLSIRQTGSLDTRYIAEQLGMSEADVRREVIEAGLGYENPLTHSMEAAHEYLSGNVREKMQQAEANNEDGRYTPNITALRKVVPHTIPSHFIEFSIGSSWIRPDIFEQYVKERTGANVKLTYAGGMWAMDKPRRTGEQDKSFGIRSEICEKVITGTELIEAAMTNRTIRVSKQQKDGPTISDPKATSACAAKVDEIRDDFKSWMRSRMESAPELAKEIEETYNGIFNNSAPMTIPDEYIPEYFDGAARVIGGKSIKMRTHQAKAIVRGTMQSLMLAHEVGTGKTFTLITTAMEIRRLGTAKKPMIVVQNATLGQFVASAKALYPDARILSLEDRDRNAEGRKDFYAKIRYNDWDMVVIPQSVLERIPDHPDRERRFIEESIQEKMDVIEAMSKDREAGRAVAALKKDVENLRDQLNKLSDTETAESEVMERVMVTPGSKPKKDGKRAAITKENAKTRAEEMLNRATDDTLNFDDLGVDAILVDEAHEYKHLGFATAMQRGVKGIDPSYSKKCQGLYLKVKAVQEKSGGRNVIFATGTPISNTAAEVWTFMRYLLPREVMEGHNIWHFDDFVRNFGSIQQMLEFTTQGTYKENNRFAGYSNLPELARIWAGITDTVLTAEAGEVKSQIPELEGGQPTDLYLPQTNGLRAVLKFVRAQLKAYDEMSGQEKKENSHIPLVMYGIAKAAAIDARLVMANAPDDTHSKTNEAVRQALRSLEDSKAYNGTVAIFADNYQRKNKETGAVEFNLFDDIRTKLIAHGVPAEQIVIMRDGMTDKAKEKIFTKVNAGEIRVILGTTQRLGVGVNIQERLHTLMHIDAPNRPMDYWQRMGRLLRQGNMHKEMGIPVRVIRFGVEDSLDVTAYQRLKTKGAIADAIMHSQDLLANNLENRILEEAGDEFGNITAELSGSQYAMLQNQTEKELRKLQAKQDQHRQHQMYIHRAEPKLREAIERNSGNIVRSDEILALLENNPTTITINGKTYRSRDDMQKVFEAHNKAMAAKKQSVQQNEPITSTLTFDIGNVHFTMTTHVSQMAGYGSQGTLAFDVQVQHDVVSHDIDYKRSYGDIPLKRIINELVDNVTSGKEERSNREAWVNAKERNEIDLAALLKDKGKPFEHGKRIKELEQKLEEYTIAMQEELQEKEAKYAEMDANIEDATEITFTAEDDEENTEQGDGNKFRDGEGMTAGERLRAIRALAPIDVARNNLSREELREIYNNLPSVEKDGREIAFYRSAFKKIYKEGGLFGQVVPVLDEVLEKSVLAYSEEDNRGGVERPDGTIHKEHPNVDSFDNYVGKVSFGGKEYYVRTTVERQSAAAGAHSFFVSEVEIYEKPANGLSVPNFPSGESDHRRIVDAKLQQFFERASYEALELDKADRVRELSEKLNTPVRIVTEQSEIENLPSARHRRAKGYFDPSAGEVVIVVPNNRNVADVDNTFVHEVVGHKGLRALVGEERFDEFLGEVYDHASNPIRKVIDRMTDRMVNDEADRLRTRKAKAHERAGEDVNANYYIDMAAARVEAEAKREKFRQEATEEYLSDLAGRIGSEGFEKMSLDELTLWGKIKAKVQAFLDKFLRGLKIASSIRLNDKELAYILYKSWKNLREKKGEGGVFADAEDAVMRWRTGFGESKLRSMTEAEKAEVRKETIADRIENLFNKAVNGDLTGKPVEIGLLTPEGKAYLERLSGMKQKDDVSFVLNPSDLVHIHRRHFGSNEKDGRNIPLTIDDIRQLVEIIAAPDRVMFGKERGGNERNMFFFLKDAGDGSYNLMEIYSDKKGHLTAKSFFKSKEAVSQRAMLLNESSTLTSVTDGASLSDGAKLPNFFEYPKTEEEDGVRFRDGDLGIEEYITKMKAEAMQANTSNLQAKRDAMRAISGNLNHLRQAMARQREYDITTVKNVADLARVLMDNNLLDDLSKYETKRILGAINNVVGKQDVSQYVQKVMDIMVDNQLRMGANTLGRLLSIRGSRVDARGIEVQGELDPDGQRIAQVVRKSTSLPKDDIDNRIAEAINRISSTDQAIADEATIEYAGLQIARQYVEDITESKAEEKALRDSIKESATELKLGHMDKNTFEQYRKATDDAIRQNKIERAEAYHSLVEQVGGVLSESVERAKAWREAEKQRVEEIHHNANSDMEGRPTNEHHKDNRIQKFVNNDLARFALAPLATFDQMLRLFGKKNSRGEGYLWNRYMRGWVSASEKEYKGYRDALKVLDAKVSEIYGKDMTWGDLFGIDRKLPKASVRFFDGGEMKDHELTQGNLLYIYMADKMSDGRMKLRRMGITEEDIEDIKKFLDPKFIQLADWMQEEFLVDKRNEYNEVHKRMFGASMAAIENYFPLKILSNARLENVDVADGTTDTALPATSTGSIIKRRRNNLALDVTGANAFSVILDHLQQMERWAAFAEFNRDLNTLLSYKRFRNQVMNMSSVYGAGKTLWNNFRNVCSMAAGAYRPPIAALDKMAVNIAKGVTAAKVSFRVFTALKQFLSMPAYASDSNPLYLAANIANPIGAWRWSMENLPLFEKRWRSRMAGDPRLLKSEMDWKMWRSRIVELASRVGMSPNAFVDALTVAIGAHAMYQTKLAKYKRQGYDPDVAEERAKQDATILFNQTQQSSEGAFLSTMQVDRSWLSVLFTVFRNSSMSYTRQLYDSIRNIGRRLTPGYKAMSEEFMAKQMRRDGIDPDKADRNAKQEYRRGIIRDLVRVGIFGYVLQLAWNLGAYLPYLIFGDDDDEKDKMWDDVFTHTMFGSIEGLTGGDVYSNTLNAWAKGEKITPWVASKDMPLSSDLENIWSKWNTDEVSAMNDVINLLVQSAVGVNPQSLTDAVVAIMDVCGDDAQTSRECALLMTRIINCPQSQLDKIYFDELGTTGEEASQMTPYEIAERYARYKVRRGAPLTGWAYGNEQREKIMDKYRKKSNTLAKERLTRETDTQARPNMTQWLEEFEATKDRVRDIKKVKSRDEDRYYELLDKLEATPEFSRYEIIRAYKHDVDELTKEWLNATTPAQRDSCAQAILTLKRDMVRELSDTQQ